MNMDKKNFIKEFEENKEVAELKALNKLSLERTLTDSEFKRMVELGNKLINFHSKILKGGKKE